jgi:L-glutamine:2-deoxy-scyllo-inosose/3-amino-2,3-dideoxy-scyllo-inosose aminotransferase
MPNLIQAPAVRLAVDGGSPVRSPQRRWPVWPQPAPEAADALLSVLGSGRWAISSPHRGPLREQQFAAHFAAYLGVRHCVPVDHGSSALVAALESLGLEYGDTVLVPALTWVATATACLRAGLVPVLVDVLPDSGCLDASTLDLSVEPRAVLAVHWACSMADIPGLQEALAGRDVSVVEDAAQAHGASWLGRRAGTLGRIGCFSLQNSKVLTAGEGGAVVTDDEALALKLQELRADSRSYRTDEPVPGELDLAETTTVMGANFCLSEFAAALADAQLGQLDRQHEVRNRNHALLGRLLDLVPGVRLLRARPEQDVMSIYEAPLVFDRLPPGKTNADVARALTAELHVPFYPPREPLYRSRLLQPWTKPSLAPLTRRFQELHRDRAYPNADRLATHAVLTHHSTFLGTAGDMADIAAAVGKVTAGVEL